MAVSIRPGGPEDYDTALDIYFVSGTARRDGRPIEDWRLAQVRDEIRNPEAWLLMAEDVAIPVGMASAMPSRLDHGNGDLVPGLCYFGFVFVVPQRWGEGIGSLLVDTMLAHVVKRGYSRVHLWTHDNNARAYAMYARRGFVRTGRSRPSSNDPDITISEWARDLV